MNNNKEHLGKIPPQAIDVEEAVLGAVMLESEAYYKVAPLLNSGCFYKDEHRILYETVAELASGNQKIDLLTVTRRLKDKNLLEQVGGPTYVTKLTSRVVSAAHIEHHARIIYDKYFARQVIAFASRLQAAAFNDSSDDLDTIYSIETRAIDDLMLGATGMVHIKEVLKKTTKELEKAQIKIKDGKTTGLPTGFVDLDKITGGWQPTDSIVIAARPSMGKTAFALALAKAAAQRKEPVNIFSLEMSKIRLSIRMILSNGGLDRDIFRRKIMTDDDWKRYNRSASEIGQLPIYIDDTPRPSTRRISSIVRNKARKGECSMGIVDYLQLADNDVGSPKYSQNREQDVAQMSRDMKLTAKESNIPMISLSQLNRAIETRQDKRPVLSDLRESGAIEQDADIVIMLWRPCYYDPEATDENGNSLKGLMFLEVVKNREGQLGTIIIKHNEDLTQFYDFNTYNQQEYNYTDSYY